MFSLSVSVIEGQDIPARLNALSSAGLHSAMLTTATEALAIYLPQLKNEAPRGPTRANAGDKLANSFSGRLIDMGEQVDAQFLTSQPQKLSWITDGTAPHVILPVDAKALRFKPTGVGEYIYRMSADNKGIRNRNDFVRRIKERIRSYVSYRLAQEVEISVRNS